MSWVKIDDQLHSNPKVLQCSLAARGLWLMCLSWVGDKETDGILPVSVARLHAGADYAALSAELIEAGLWIEDGRNLVFKDYLEYNRSAEQIEAEREATATRQGRFRDNRKKRNGVTNAVTTAPVTGAPVPVPVPGICTPSSTTYITREEEPQPTPTSQWQPTDEAEQNTLTADLEADPYLPPPPTRRKAQAKASEERRERAVALIAAFRAARFGTAPGAAIPPAEYERMKQAAFDLISADASPEQVARATCAALERWSDDSRVTLPAIAGNLTALLAPVNARAAPLHPQRSRYEQQRIDNAAGIHALFDEIEAMTQPTTGAPAPRMLQ